MRPSSKPGDGGFYPQLRIGAGVQGALNWIWFSLHSASRIGPASAAEGGEEAGAWHRPSSGGGGVEGEPGDREGGDQGEQLGGGAVPAGEAGEARRGARRARRPTHRPN